MHGARYSQVRRLARQYADQELPREEYLARRRTLIRAIASGKISLRYAGLQGIVPDSAPQRLRQPLVLAAAAILVIAAIGAGLHFLDRPAPTPPPRSSRQVSRPTGPGVALVRRFVRTGDWSEDSTIHFETQMLQLTPRQRAKLRESVWFRRLSAELARQITEQEAMAPLDPSGRAKQRARSLKAFAARLQIDPDA